MNIFSSKRIDVVYAALIVIFCFFAEYLVAKSQVLFTYKFIFILICLGFKIAFIIARSFKSIVGIVRKGTAYHIYLIYIAANAILIISSFGTDYFALQLADSKSFVGMEGVKNEFEIFFKMFYLSLLLFTNLGVADIVPKSTQSEILVMFEGIIAFVSLIFMLSDYTTLRESFSAKNPQPEVSNDKT